MAEKDGKALRHLCLHDLFFLLTVACKRVDADNDWAYARCREVEFNPNGHLDLWAREHYKSTIITFALTIQSILLDPEVTIGIFSHTRPIAKGFLKQIKTELENNTFLQSLFPEILYTDPQRESLSWSLDNGITVKRKSNPVENTVEAWGLVDGQPTSRHFVILLYDDVVTNESVSTPDQIFKTTQAWELSLNLGRRDAKQRYAGTIYHFRETYREIAERGGVKVRKHPATADGTPDGEPVFLTKEQLQLKRAQMGPYTFASQMLLNPLADEAQKFKEEWLNYYDGKLDYRQMNVYIVCDPANAKKKNNDYTVIEVWGAAADQNLYLLDALRDRLNLTERTDRLFQLHRQYRPRKVGYEQYSMQADVQHIRYVQEQQQYRFGLVELAGNTPKPDRIKSMIPKWESARMWLPRRLLKRGYDGRTYDFIQQFRDDEFLCFPVGAHDDMLDCAARLEMPELGVTFPLASSGRSGYSDWHEQLPPAKPVTANNAYDVLP